MSDLHNKYKFYIKDTSESQDTFKAKSLTKYTIFSSNLLIVDIYSKIPKLYVIGNITTEEVTDKLDMFQARFGKLDKSGWWDRDIIQTDTGTQFTLKDFQEVLSVRRVQISLAAPDHQEMNGKFEVTC